jgi:hypothetical protein
MKLFFLLSLAIGIVFSSCQKEYTCVCTHISTGELSQFEKIKTTHLGKKGLAKTCSDHEQKNADLKDCHLE